MKSPHVSCIYYLYRAQTPMTAKELCDVCDEDKASISRSIDHLESNGYIKCLSDAKKRYRSPLELTKKGTEIGERLAEKIDGILELAGEGLSDDERTSFYRALLMIHDNLQSICEKYDHDPNNNAQTD